MIRRIYIVNSSRHGGTPLMAFSDATEACEFARRVAKNSMRPYAMDELIHEVQLSEGSAVDEKWIIGEIEWSNSTLRKN